MTGALSTSSNEPVPAAAFWQAFCSEEPSWRSLGMREKVEAMNALAARFFPEIALELLGQEHDEAFGLCVTAHGDIEAFPLVMELVRTAPALERYRVEAFRSRTPMNDFAITMNGFSLSTSDVLIHQWADGAYAGLDIAFAREVPEEFEEHAQRMLFILLDHVIGEYDFAVKVGTIRNLGAKPDDGRSYVSLQDFPLAFDSFWRNELGHSGVFPDAARPGEDEGEWSILEMAPVPDEDGGEDESEETAVVMVNNAAMPLAMRADLSYAMTLTQPASDDAELEHAQEIQEQIGGALEQRRLGVFAYTLFKADSRSAVYYVSDANEAEALARRSLGEDAYELSGEYDFAWSNYCYFATA